MAAQGPEVTTYPVKITFGEMRASGVRDVLIVPDTLSTATGSGLPVPRAADRRRNHRQAAGRPSNLALAGLSGGREPNGAGRTLDVPVSTIKTWLRRTLENVRTDCLLAQPRETLLVTA